MRIKCLTLEGSILESNKYMGPSGKEYVFFKNSFTEVADDKDAEYFLNAGRGLFFKAEGVIDKAKAILSNVASSPAPTTEDVPKTIAGSLFTLEGIKNLNKRQQEFIIKAVKGKNTHMPRTEDERVDAIFKLQGEGSDIGKTLSQFA